MTDFLLAGEQKDRKRKRKTKHFFLLENIILFSFTVQYCHNPTEACTVYVNIRVREFLKTYFFL